MIKIEKGFRLEEGVDCSFINPFSLGVVVQCLSEKECSEIRFYADGIAVVLYARLFKRKRIERVSFDDTSIAPIVLRHAQVTQKRVALIGGTEENILQAAELLEKKYPSLEITYARSGFFRSDEERQQSLAHAANADIVIVGMGAGKQEHLLLDLRGEGWQGTGFTCGGYLDQFVQAKGQNYYPAWVNRLNLRWLYRVMKEPNRLLKRYLKDYPKFLIKYGNKIE
ncbi:WecB/TagA/CpsF family glycosyltransferase [Halomonas sp. PBN3]|uniref:WecB/TagA/CpsF family glycosyltransferase n=1 Tax=Halomonas sp. PBN3 TaxID=1397528 RepID=UPI0013785494|nr:WecB/TagA/CpsF family glycosyltransferase [Halomonas sp. PBN3]